MTKRKFERASKEWIVEFSVIPAGKQAGEETEHVVTAWAETSADALIEAALSLRYGLGAGDIIHYVHVSPPHKEKPE